MKAGFYGRQSVLSTRDDERRDLYTSTDWQVIDGHARVRRQGGEIVRTYRDEGISGYTGALRPEFERLLIDVDDSSLAAASTPSPVSWPPMAWSAPRASRWGAGRLSAW